MSSTPLNLSHAIDLALASDDAEPAVSWEPDTGAAFVVLRHSGGTEDWMVGFRLVPSAHGGEWKPTEFALRQVETLSTFGMTSKAIRLLPIGELLTAARKAVNTRHTETPQQAGTFRLTTIDRLAPFKTDARGKAPRGDEAYANLALEYSFLVQDGDRSPVKTLVAREGGTAGTWSTRITEARRRGFLTPVKSGEAGGGITEAALRLLGWDPEADAMTDAQIAAEEAARAEAGDE